MFGLGPGEILLIAIALVVLLAMGKLPDVARQAGGAFRTYRKAQREVTKLTNPINWIDVDAKETPPAAEKSDTKRG